MPAWAILTSTVVGFLCVIAAAISPKGVFLFLLNSSGAIILFVYLLICLSQLRMRRMVPPEKLIVKMWFYPVLTVLTALAIVAVLIAMGLPGDPFAAVAQPARLGGGPGRICAAPARHWRRAYFCPRC